ncbi:MAG: hypothetical protein ABIQ06_12425 [Caldimonas sp.]
MLRGLLAVLLAANLLFFGFTRGWFDGLFGLSALGDREPGRIASQVRPATIVLMPMASAPPGTSGSCLESAPVAAAETAAAEAALKAALPAGTWTDQRSESTVGAATVVTHVYRVGNADPATAARLATLRLDSSGRGFSACARLEPGR